jgi:hypothetical protein
VPAGKAVEREGAVVVGGLDPLTHEHRAAQRDDHSADGQAVVGDDRTLERALGARVRDDQQK